MVRWCFKLPLDSQKARIVTSGDGEVTVTMKLTDCSKGVALLVLNK